MKTKQNLKALLVPTCQRCSGCGKLKIAIAWQSAMDWVIVGGKSGPGARPCDIDWIVSIIRQCQSSRVPVFVKQLGSNPVNLGGEGKLRDRKGGSIAEWPEYLQVREFPV